jgi:hypothetical protein
MCFRLLLLWPLQSWVGRVCVCVRGRVRVCLCFVDGGWEGRVTWKFYNINSHVTDLRWGLLLLGLLCVVLSCACVRARVAVCRQCQRMPKKKHGRYTILSQHTPTHTTPHAYTHQSHTPSSSSSASSFSTCHMHTPTHNQPHTHTHAHAPSSSSPSAAASAFFTGLRFLAGAFFLGFSVVVGCCVLVCGVWGGVKGVCISRSVRGVLWCGGVYGHVSI